MQDLLVVKLAWLIPLMPLIGAAVSGFFGKRFLKGNSHWPIWLSVGASALMSLTLLFQAIGLARGGGEGAALSAVTHWYTWIDVGGFNASAGALIDPLTCVMLAVVTGIGFFITVFAAGYMKGEEGYYRFFAYLGLFIFSMTCLVLGNNFVMLYLGWEGVGLCSYLLVGYYFERPAAREAAKKAFIVNRVGDFGFGLGIMSIFLVFGSVTYFTAPGAGGSTAGVLQLVSDPAFIAALPAWKQELVRWIPFLLMLGAFGKSAQFPLYVWLPDAMEGPTPVSALIHAATMVTAGVYMITRSAPLFVGSAAAMATIAAVGAFTVLFAASIALRQFDLKKVFAFSTVSQLGYMFVGAGVLAPTAAVFHLVTHAFFKALLFLGSGVVMHAMSGHLDMRKMSGLKRVLPKTNVLMLVGCAALAGFPGFSGFFSKDEIIGRAFHVNTLLWLVVLFGAFLTAYYTFRLYFQVFQGPLVVPEGPAPTEPHAAVQPHAAADDAHANRAGGVMMIRRDGSAHGRDPVGGSSDLGTATSTERAEAGASHSAVVTGDAAVSGVDHAAQAHGVAGHGAHGGDEHHDHEPLLMIVPLAVLAVGAILAGFLNWPSDSLARFLGHSPSFQLGYQVAAARFADGGGAALDPALWGQVGAGEAAGGSNLGAMFVGGVVAIAGIALAYLMHLADRGLADRVAARLQPLTGLLEGKYWVDQIYDWVIVEPLRQVGRVFVFIDYLIDGVVWLCGFVPEVVGGSLKISTQRGYLQGYAAAMLLGLAVILAFVFLR